jgi:hypothetical protein
MKSVKGNFEMTQSRQQRIYICCFFTRDVGNHQKKVNEISEKVGSVVAVVNLKLNLQGNSGVDFLKFIVCSCCVRKQSHCHTNPVFQHLRNLLSTVRYKGRKKNSLHSQNSNSGQFETCDEMFANRAHERTLARRARRASSSSSSSPPSAAAAASSCCTNNTSSQAHQPSLSQVEISSNFNRKAAH